MLLWASSHFPIPPQSALTAGPTRLHSGRSPESGTWRYTGLVQVTADRDHPCLWANIAPVHCTAHSLFRSRRALLSPVSAVTSPSSLVCLPSLLSAFPSCHSLRKERAQHSLPECCHGSGSVAAHRTSEEGPTTPQNPTRQGTSNKWIGPRKFTVLQLTLLPLLQEGSPLQHLLPSPASADSFQAQGPVPSNTVNQHRNSGSR